MFESIYHRDVKPKNLLLDIANTSKLCDFGVAENSCWARVQLGRLRCVHGSALSASPVTMHPWTGGALAVSRMNS